MGMCVLEALAAWTRSLRQDRAPHTRRAPVWISFPGSKCQYKGGDAHTQGVTVADLREVIVNVGHVDIGRD